MWKKGNLLRKNQTSRYIKDVQIFFRILEEVISTNWLLQIVYYFFLWTGTTFSFFLSSGKIPLSKHDLKITSRGLHIDSPHIFNICMLILSKFELFLDVITKIDYIRQKPVYFKQELRRQTAVVINYSALFSKKEFNNSALFFKSVTNLFS